MKYIISLTEEQLQELEKRKKASKEKRIFKRLHCIELKNKGIVNRRIAESLDVSERTIITWYKLFIEKGFNGLCSFDYKPRKSYLEEYSNEIDEYINDYNISSSNKLKKILEDKHKLMVPSSTLRSFLKKLTVTRKRD